MTGRGPRSSALLAAPQEPPEDQSPQGAIEPADAQLKPGGGDQAAARIDAARERLRATIAVPEDPPEEPADDA